MNCSGLVTIVLENNNTDKEVRERQINYVKSQLRDQDLRGRLARRMLSASGKTALYSQIPWCCSPWVDKDHSEAAVRMNPGLGRCFTRKQAEEVQSSRGSPQRRDKPFLNCMQAKTKWDQVLELENGIFPFRSSEVISGLRSFLKIQQLSESSSGLNDTNDQPETGDVGCLLKQQRVIMVPLDLQNVC